LSRRVCEEIVIGDNICVTVLAIHGKQVRLGITAPLEMPILRKELCGPPDQSTGPNSGSRGLLESQPLPHGAARLSR